MIYVPDNSDLKKVIMREFHANPYSVAQVIGRH